MFGLSDSTVRDSMDSALYPWNTTDSWSSVGGPPPTPLDLDAATGVDYPRLNYIDSADDGFGVQKFILQDPGGAGAGPLVATVVPSMRLAVEDWAYTMVYYGAGSPAADYPSGTVIRRSGTQDNAIWLVRNQLAKWDVTYKDPFVVNLGGTNGWLMLLSRTRKTSGEGGGNGPDECLSDIVAYWSTETEPDFTDKDKVTGPYWIGVNIGTLGRDTPGVRFWLSVPTGAMISATDLMVYFVCERTEYSGGVTYDSLSSLTAVFDSLAPLDRSAALTFRSCLVGHRVSITDLDAMRSAGLYGNEKDWALTSSAGRYYRVPKLGRGVVFLWLDDGSGAPDIDLVDESDYLKIADPACARCSLDETTIGMFEYVRLFVAGNVRAGTDSTETAADKWAPRGLWYSSPLGEGAYPVTRRDGTGDRTHEGYDFLLGTSAPFVQANESAASVVNSALVEQLFIDPDPTELSDGTWRVAFGVRESQSPPADGLVILAEVESADGVVCSEVGADRANAVDAPPDRVAGVPLSRFHFLERSPALRPDDED
jgi:hypothetical protein